MTLTAAELTWMRASTEADLLPDTCTITPRTHTVDDVGGWADGDGTPVTGVKCLVFAVDPTRQGQMIGLRVKDEPLWEIWIPYDDAITNDSRVTFDSDTYEVVWADDDSSEIFYRRAMMRKLP